jgi:hypothetical protein
MARFTPREDRDSDCFRMSVGECGLQLEVKLHKSWKCGRWGCAAAAFHSALHVWLRVQAIMSRSLEPDWLAWVNSRCQSLVVAGEGREAMDGDDGLSDR